ncbi:CPBP family glutamic-type intramembrane protease [Kribbella sp. NPDC056861]|uniref:CPBP family glutamic-type intramembrane protease n=1 Tax=Kribbella sp. NPDC056861 TaxID=3154857 RepID=UPI00342606F5
MAPDNQTPQGSADGDRQQPPAEGNPQPPATSGGGQGEQWAVGQVGSPAPGEPAGWVGGWQAPGRPPSQPPYGGAPAGAPHLPPGPSPYGQLPGPAPYAGAPQYGGQPQYGPPVGQPYPGPPPYAPSPYGVHPHHYAAKQPRAVPPPPGTPYHRLARTRVHKWWRPIVGTLVLAFGAIAATIAVVIGWEIVHAMITGDFAEPASVDALFDNPTEDIAVNLVMLGALTPVVLFTAWWIQRRPALSVASVLQKIRWRWMLLCCLPALGYMALNFGLGAAFEELFPGTAEGTDPSDDGSFVGWARFVVPALVILFLVPFQSAAEEFLFRGWLVQAIGSWGPDNTDGKPFVQNLKRLFRTPWPALVVSSVAFVFGHGYTGWAMADIFLFAMTVGWLTIRTGGLETGIALHSVNNIVAFMVPAALGQLDGWSDQGGAPWPVFVLDVPCIALYAYAVLWLAKRQQIARVS